MLPPEVLMPREAHFELFMKEEQYYGIFYTHYLGWWAHKDAPNILILMYERMKKDPRTAVVAVAEFLGHQLSDEVIDVIVHETSFDTMKNNQTANKQSYDTFTNPDVPFMNKGMVGYWKNVLTAEQSARIDAIVAEKIDGSGIIFDYGNN